ncbi:MAG: hypothetical protein PW788_03470 [Micavibrio sp.]|nr:hypothetical protein [Micavibrio sp.]
MMIKPAAFFRLALLALALLAAQPAFAAGKKLYAEPDLTDRRYYYCQRDDQCQAAKLPCGRVVVVNTPLHDDVQGWFDFIGPRYQCEQPVKQQKADKIACVKNACTAEIGYVQEIPADSALGKDPAYCEKTEDCAVVVGRCQAKIFVNKLLQKSMQAKYDRLRRVHSEGCFWPDNRTVKNLRCEKNACIGDLEVPDQNYWNDPVKIQEGQSDKELDKREKENEQK